MGNRAARTTAKTATPGTTSPTTRPARAPTAGARTGWPGISDDKQRLCFALALWNGKDPILKERLFGLTNSESNHGEDVKEYYFYLDSTPTHSYMKYLYKYPQAAFPYADLVETSRRRGRNEMEYELLDTGVFDQDRYFDVFVEYAKESSGRHPDPDHGPPTAARRRPSCTSCPRSGSATSGRVASPDLPRDRRSSRSTAPAGASVGQGGRIPVLGERIPLLRRRRAAAVHRERNQHAAASFGVPEPRAPTSRTASTTAWCSGQAGRGESGEEGNEGRRPIIG